MGQTSPALLRRRTTLTQPIYPPDTNEITQRRKQLAPGAHDAFQQFSREVFAEGVLDNQRKPPVCMNPPQSTNRLDIP